MKVLFIGGTGTISYNCSKLAIEKGFEVSLLNRGKSTLRKPLVGAELIWIFFWGEQTNISSFLLPVPIRHRQKNYL